MQRTVFLRFLIPVIALAYAGCGGNRSYVPVTHPDQRIVLGHFSFLPPSGKNWKTSAKPRVHTVGRLKGYLILFAKTFSGNETVAAGAHLHIFREDEDIDKEKLIQYYEIMWAYPPDHPKIKMVDSRYSFDDSYNALCLLYENKNKEKRAPGFSGPDYISQNRGISCVHPKHGNEIYSLNTNQTYPRGESPANFQDELEPFLTSLQWQ